MEGLPPKPNMLYRNLGNTGIKVSVFSFGNWVTTNTPEQQALMQDVMAYGYENGINFFDTAEAYGAGAGENFFGKVFSKQNWPRSSYVLSTKIFWGGAGPNDKGLSRKHLIEGMNNSLKRMNQDYCDVLFCHRPDRDTPIEETVRAMNYLIKQNKILYWGTSEWSAAEIVEAYRQADLNGLIPPTVEQPQYNMLYRDRFEKEYEFVFRTFGYGSTTWSPLASGVLTGKYNSAERLKGTRLGEDSPIMNTIWDRFFNDEVKDANIKKLNALENCAKQLGVSQAQLSLAWTAANQDVSTVILGATRKSQLEENLKSLDLLKRWTPEIEKKVEDILKNKPETERNYKGPGKLKARRDERLYIGK